MFIWDFVADTVLGQIIDWIYGQIIGFLGDFFMQMGNMGADLFELSWVQSIVLFFSYLAWALYATGLVVAVFECGIECQNGRGSIKDTALNAVKGFMAVSLFSVLPVELYKLCVSLQGSFTVGITGFGEDFGTVASSIITSLQDAVLIAGLMVVKDHALLGLGLMLSSGEIPRIAGQFGLDTGTRANVMGAVYAAQGAVNLTRTIVQVVSK